MSPRRLQINSRSGAQSDLPNGIALRSLSSQEPSNSLILANGNVLIRKWNLDVQHPVNRGSPDKNQFPTFIRLILGKILAQAFVARGRQWDESPTTCFLLCVLPVTGNRLKILIRLSAS